MGLLGAFGFEVFVRECAAKHFLHAVILPAT